MRGPQDRRECREPIAEGELRLSEAFVSTEGRWARAHQTARTYRPREYSDDHDRRGYDSQNPDVWSRFHHLACAAPHQPYKLRSALAATALEIPDRVALEQAIERALSAVDAAEERAETRDEYLMFIARLREAPDDELLLVFADWLQSVEDPRGELITLHHALEAATGDEHVRLADLEKKLLAVHRKHLVADRIDGTLGWRRGIVHRVVLTTVERESLARAFGHPSFRIVRELVADVGGWTSVVVAANLPTPLPPTLRVLELRNRTSTDTLGAIAPLLAAAVPQLERLVLAGSADLRELRHPSLAELELVCVDATAARLATPRGEPETTHRRGRVG